MTKAFNVGLRWGTGFALGFVFACGAVLFFAREMFNLAVRALL
jgi:hypothetical protein